MKNSSHLLLRTQILPGESLPSYLVRLAKLNGYHTPNMVAQICHERLSQPDGITHPTRAETFARLAELVKLEDEHLFAASAHTFAITILSASAEPELITLRSGTSVVLLPSAVLRQHLWSETDKPVLSSLPGRGLISSIGLAPSGSVDLFDPSLFAGQRLPDMWEQTQDWGCC